MFRRVRLRLSLRTFNHVSVRNRTDRIEDFTDYRHTDVRPVVFTHKMPSALEGIDLDNIANVHHHADPSTSDLGRRSVNSSDSVQVPIVPLQEDIHGLPDHLVQYMKGKGFESLTPVQAKALARIYARHDAAVCAPTGSGKTFAFCLAIMARLIREGPPKLKSIIILTPSDGLCVQISKWLHEMWLWPGDERLCLVMNNEMRDSFAYRALTWHSEERDHRPYIIVATPSRLLTFCEAREKAIKQKNPRHNFSLTPIFQILDTLVIDEVDEVLVPGDDAAPGNVLLQKYLTHAKYQAPVQRVFVSATLSATTVNHIRRFLRKSLLAHTATHIFENEIKESNAAGRAGGRNANSSKLRVPDCITHEAFSADTVVEQRESITKVIARDVGAAKARRLTEAESAPLSQTKSIAEAPMEPLRCAVIIPMSADVNMISTEVLLRAWPSATLDLSFLGRSESRFLERAQSEALRSMLAEESGSDVSDSTIDHGKKQAGARDNTNGDGIFENKTSQEVSHASLIPNPTVTFFLCRSETARGLDISDLSHVFIMSIPVSALEFAHFVGRVGRMGREGKAITLSPRGSLRSLNLYCEAAGVKMNLHRRLAPVDV